MARREIIKINEELCDGCGECVPACAEGAIQIIDGKARLVGDVLCDGMGACLGHCPTGALTIEVRDAEEYDEVAVRQHHGHQDRPQPLQALQAPPLSAPMPRTAQHSGGCPGSAVRQFVAGRARPGSTPNTSQQEDSPSRTPSQLGHWPVQLKLVPPHAAFLKDADLLICADCVPFAVPDFHARYLAGRAVLVGCPKLDDLPHYSEKLQAIFAEARPRQITVLRMEVPCCGGIADAAVNACIQACPHVPLEVHTIGIQGGIDCRGVPVTA